MPVATFFCSSSSSSSEQGEGDNVPSSAEASPETPGGRRISAASTAASSSAEEQPLVPLMNTSPTAPSSWATQLGHTLEWEEAAEPGRAKRGEKECIRVAARFRPLDEDELAEGSDLCVRFGGDGKSCAISVGRIFGVRELNFDFDHVFTPGSSQQDVYAAVAQPIVEGVMQGINGAIIAYGQTGSGKTYTMFGPQGAQAFRNARDDDSLEAGVIPMALKELLRQGAASIQLRASYVEIYQEHIIDLLAPCPSGEVVHVGMQECNQSLYLPEVTETPLSSVREALGIIKLGNKNRHAAETHMNAHSSRSHAVFIVTVTNSMDTGRHKFAQLYLVDLAGSERIGRTKVHGQQLDEAKQINRSLLALGQVVWSLAHRQKHIPYRDSKLTQLLRNCLGGNARTAILVTASPHAKNSHESLNALQFGARAAIVKNKARVNVAEDPRELKRLLARAREDLADLRGHCQRLEAQAVAASMLDPPPPPGGRQAGAGRVEALQALSEKRRLLWELLPSLVCPLTRAIMRDPVCAADGWTYERLAIERHFARGGRGVMPLSPVTGQRLCSRQLVPCLVVKHLVHKHLPDLSPLEAPLPGIALLPIWLVQSLLHFLDASSVACCETAWPSFLAAADACGVWGAALARDFPEQAKEAKGGDLNPRQVYATSAAEAAASSKGQKSGGTKPEITYGLKLFKPAARQ